MNKEQSGPRVSRIENGGVVPQIAEEEYARIYAQILALETELEGLQALREFENSVNDLGDSKAYSPIRIPRRK